MNELNEWTNELKIKWNFFFSSFMSSFSDSPNSCLKRDEIIIGQIRSVQCVILPRQNLRQTTAFHLSSIKHQHWQRWAWESHDDTDKGCHCQPHSILAASNTNNDKGEPEKAVMTLTKGCHCQPPSILAASNTNNDKGEPEKAMMTLRLSLSTTFHLSSIKNHQWQRWDWESHDDTDKGCPCQSHSILAASNTNTEKGEP